MAGHYVGTHLVMLLLGFQYRQNFLTRVLVLPNQELALDAVRTVTVEQPGGGREIDVKKYAKVEKLPGGSIEECRVLSGVMFQKDVVAPGRMRRKIRSPRVLLLDCPLEYKKGENQTNVELTKEEDWWVFSNKPNKS